MNIYLITTDSESICWQAKTMAQAVSRAEHSYLYERREAEGDKFCANDERQYFHDQLLESCALIGELANP